MNTLLALIALACHPSPEAPERRAAYLLAHTGDTGDLEGVSSWVLVGQSNACGFDAIPPGFHSLASGGDHFGATLVRNGIDRAQYTGVVAPDAFVIDELILSGYAPDEITLVARCAQGAYLDAMRDTLLPAVEADLSARDLPPPLGVILWQGEAEAKAGRDRALDYADDLAGVSGGYSFLEGVWSRWPSARVAVIELAVRADSYADPEGEALVRSAQHLAGASPGVCTVPTYGASFLPGSPANPDDNPHVDLASREAISRRAVRALVDPQCP